MRIVNFLYKIVMIFVSITNRVLNLSPYESHHSTVTSKYNKIYIKFKLDSKRMRCLRGLALVLLAFFFRFSGEQLV